MQKEEKESYNIKTTLNNLNLISIFGKIKNKISLIM